MKARFDLGLIADPIGNTMTTVLMASQPWSNIIPNALLVPVFLACFPSMLSSVWYANTEKLQYKKYQLGGVLFPIALKYTVSIKDENENSKPLKVITLGATLIHIASRAVSDINNGIFPVYIHYHVGTNSVHHCAKGDR